VLKGLFGYSFGISWEFDGISMGINGDVMGFTLW
jgi:hypothetical protein